VIEVEEVYENVAQFKTLATTFQTIEPFLLLNCADRQNQNISETEGS
jgi:hypothetical protein